MDSLLKIFSYSSCSTCRKAIKWLQQNQIEYELIDIVENPPSKQILLEAFKQLSDRKKLFNTSGISYRKIGASVVKAMGDNEAIDALAADGKLIKRPFVITTNNRILVGFNQEKWNQLLLS